jgi:hypothetical protein
MPIGIDEFEGDHAAPTELSTAERIVAFLARNDEKAFTRGEIANSCDTGATTGRSPTNESG